MLTAITLVHELIIVSPRGPRRKRASGGHKDVDLVTEGGQPFRHRRDVDGSPVGARHRLIRGGVEDFHERL